MNLTDIIEELGGVATRRELLGAVSRREVEAALAAGEVVRLRTGLYALPSRASAELARAALGGTLSHQSAAAAWGWRMKLQPELPIVTVPRNRSFAAGRREGVDVRYDDLAPERIIEGVTDPLTTVVECARRLPFDEALAIADSALRSGLVTREALLEAASRSRRTGRRAAVRVARAADGRAENPFESVVRAISLEVDGVRLEPQVRVLPGITPDLVDRELRVVVECDSWRFHADKESFRRDMERYNELALAGWLVLRINWTHAMKRPAYVRGLFEEAVAYRTACSSRG